MGHASSKRKLTGSKVVVTDSRKKGAPRKLGATIVPPRESTEHAEVLGIGPTLVIDRRREVRQNIEGAEGARRVSATYSDGGNRFGVTNLELVDQSRSGLGVRTKTLIEPGMRVMICPPGSKIAWLSAKAVRCTPDADGTHFRVGLLLGSRRGA